MPEFPPDLDALTAALGGLAPATALNRNRLLYEAGRRAAVRSRRPWQVTAGAFAGLAIALGLRVVNSAVPEPHVRVVYVSEPPVEQQAPAAVASGSPLHDNPVMSSSPAAPYLRLRDQVVRFGADSLPASAPTAIAPLPPVEMLLGLPPGSLDDAHRSRWQHQLSQGDV